MSCPSCGGSRWVRYFAEREDGAFEEAFALCASCPDGRGEPLPPKPDELGNDVWLVSKAFDYGPEGNAQLWNRAGVLLSALGEMVVAWGEEDPAIRNEALVVALANAARGCKKRPGGRRPKRGWAGSGLPEGGQGWPGQRFPEDIATVTLRCRYPDWVARSSLPWGRLPRSAPYALRRSVTRRGASSYRQPLGQGFSRNKAIFRGGPRKPSNAWYLPGNAVPVREDRSIRGKDPLAG